MYCSRRFDETLALVRRIRPALVITDLLKEHEPSGEVMGRIIKSDPALKQIPILLISGYGKDHPWDRRVFCDFYQLPSTRSELAVNVWLTLMKYAP